MSERGDHLIERAAARLRTGPGIGTIPDAPAPTVAPAGAAATMPAGPADPGPAGVVPAAAFQPFAPPPPNRASVVDPPAPKAPPAHSIPTSPTMLEKRPAARVDDGTIDGVAAAPVQGPVIGPVEEPGPPPVAEAPPPPPAPRPAIEFRDSLPNAVPGPIPEPGAPFRSPMLSAVPRAINLPSGGSPFGGARPAGIPAGQPGIGRGGQQAPMVQLDALERAGMVVARTTRTRISEEYRIAIGRILRTLHEATDVQGARNVLMVTSARPGEGKSFTALNLAGSIAQNGTDAVLLIDVDPKVKPLSDQLGLGDSQGFLDLVSDPSLRPEDLLRTTAIPNLAVMPVGTRLGGAAQTIGGTASTRPIIPTITRLARRFPKHLIMLDAPPCLSTSDPHTLAPHVGQVVLVVEAERTQRTEVEAAIELVRVCPSITMLLNKVRMTTSHTFGAYDYFGSYT